MFLNVSREEQRSSVPASGSTGRRRTGSSPPATCANAGTGTTTSGRTPQMLSHTSTEWAPWHVLPADHKWFTRVCAAAVIADTLIGIDPHYPAPDPAARQELERARRTGGRDASGVRASRVRSPLIRQSGPRALRYFHSVPTRMRCWEVTGDQRARGPFRRAGQPGACRAPAGGSRTRRPGCRPGRRSAGADRTSRLLVPPGGVTHLRRLHGALLQAADAKPVAPRSARRGRSPGGWRCVSCFSHLCEECHSIGLPVVPN